jgi:YkoY family integral membrane protein
MLQNMLPDFGALGSSFFQGISNLNPQDIASIGTLVLLEGLLSADNALVLALIARRLPDEKQRNNALNIGIMLSFVFRAVGLLMASFIINFWFMRAAGAGYLLYLAANHFREKLHHSYEPEAETALTAEEKAAEATLSEDPTPVVPTIDVAGHVNTKEFRKVVIALALTDVAFAVDSILAAVALTNKLWVIYIGVVLGIVALRLVASAFIRLLERYPAFADTAYILVAWAGIKLGLEAIESFGESIHHHLPIAMPAPWFWVGMALIVTIGTFIALRRPAVETGESKEI